MPIDLKMPALSPTMEEGTLAKWLVKEGDEVKSGDLLAEIETDKATMEFEAVDEGVISKILVAEGTDGVKVGTVIATIAGEDEDASASAPAPRPEPEVAKAKTQPSPPSGGEGRRAERDGERGESQTSPTPPSPSAADAAPPASGEDRSQRSSDHAGHDRPDAPPKGGEGRVKASPLARRLAEAKGIDLGSLTGSGPNGRIVKADIDGAGAPKAAPTTATAEAPKPAAPPIETDIPHEAVKLSNMRKTIARRLTESKQQVPHIYLTVDIRLDALLKLRSELNAALASREIKLSVNDLLIKALAVSLMRVSACNVSFAGDQLIKYSRADISVAVSIPNGLITPIIEGADIKGVAAIATEMKDLAARAREGKLQPNEYQGGTASISNMGMYGIKAFDAVINPPQGMIMAIGAGEKRPYVIDDALGVATVMSATGSFDHRAIDGADGAELMKVFKELVESPLGMVA